MFYKTIDLRSRNAMQDFLQNHPRHEHIFAQSVRFRNLRIPDDLRGDVKALDWEFMVDELWTHVNAFEERQRNLYTMVITGRSNGWMCLHHAKLTDLGHRSRCLSCGAKSFRDIPVQKAPRPINPNSQRVIARMIGGLISTTHLISNRCDRCGESGCNGLENYSEPLQKIDPLNPVFIAEYDLQNANLQELRGACELMQDFASTLDVMTEDLVIALKSRGANSQS